MACVAGAYLVLLLLHLSTLVVAQVKETSVSWSELTPESSIWTARNSHATCVFNARIYVVGGHTDTYPTYNLQLNDKTADVWWTADGTSWERNILLEGDFYAQNHDVVQPGPIAPFYPRYGHSLDAYDINKDGGDDIMILMGGFAPKTINDIWITEDGVTWFFAGYAPWSPRAWHSTIRFNNTIYLMGGTPLNSEVWFIKDVRIRRDRPAPLTRAMYMDYTYEVDWGRLEDAPWSPRCAMGLVNQPFTGNMPSQENRMVLVGGYGGWLSTDDRFDGIRSQSDVWVTHDALNWTRIAESTNLGGIAWMGFAVWENEPFAPDHRMWIVGGGYIGQKDNKKVNAMDASVNSYHSRDGINWVRTNYQLGGGTTFLEQYSSNEWARTTIDGTLMFLGIWGLRLLSFQVWGESDSYLYILGGDQDGSGSLKDFVYKGENGLLCDVEGVVCNGHGVCGETVGSGCECEGLEYSGKYCDVFDGIASPGALISFDYRFILLALFISCLSIALSP